MVMVIAPRIVVDPAIRAGKPVIEGARVPVDLVLSKLAGGMTVEQISDEYEIDAADIQAVLSYAAQLVAQDEVRLVA
jgi:uncharacterized protein (DUF433 family)